MLNTMRSLFSVITSARAGRTFSPQIRNVRALTDTRANADRVPPDNYAEPWARSFARSWRRRQIFGQFTRCDRHNPSLRGQLPKDWRRMLRRSSRLIDDAPPSNLGLPSKMTHC